MSELLMNIEGRIVEQWDYETKEGKKHGHVVQTISNIDDPHNMRRSRIIVTSDRKIGQVGKDIEVKVELSGNVHDRVYIDKNTGAKKVFKDFRCYLNEVI